MLERDAYGEWHAVELEVDLALACCRVCARRYRVLPCDVLAYKHYSVAVIAHLLSAYSAPDWSLSLRATAWGLLGARTPAHTTVHGWSEGLGAHVLGLPAGEFTDQCAGWPFTRVWTETQARRPELAALWDTQVWVEPRRYRSDERSERLTALVRVLAVAETFNVTTATAALAAWSALVVRWTGTFGLRFPSTFLCTPIEHVAEAAGPGSHARSPP